MFKNLGETDSRANKTEKEQCNVEKNRKKTPHTWRPELSPMNKQAIILKNDGPGR